MSFWKIIKREFRHIFLSDPRRALYLFGASVTYALVFGLLYNNHVVNNIPLAIYDEDQSQISRRLVQAFEDSEKYRIIAHVSSQEEMEQMLREKTVYAALEIPADFAKAVKLGRTATVLLDANGANMAIVNTLISSAQEIVLTFATQVGVGMVEGIGQLPAVTIAAVAPIDLRLRLLHNPTLSYLNFFVLGLVMTAWQQGLFLAAGAGILHDLLPRQEVSGVSHRKLLVAKLLVYWLCGLVALALTLIVVVQLFGIPWRSGFWPLFSLASAFAFAALATASLLATLCRDEVTYIQFSLIYSFSSFVFSGYTWPQLGMLPIAALVSYSFPLTYFAPTIRELALAGYSPDLTLKIVILLLIGILFATVSLWRFRQLQRSESPKDGEMIT